ncbi:iron-containing alcohol dehydrogenase [Proteiniclasticum sp. BAD-10]|uniref:Iron-containing alcohol dehydrogenase n=1 Tax=Proteiniclasticum sediminis TaxID=2804028 RepID=A0A941CRZ1_9CLOT|nr:iron-containing alcohol dehydrogenase family protein [Proteiniclasticum sediminis]MBR0577029.1 iron-containing alcohol dehydrogenase [Proteiniclasticum sediminis]
MYKFTYGMPTTLIVGSNCLVENSDVFRKYGHHALIVTGTHSSKLNGSLEDSILALENENIRYTIFDKVEEDPTLETVERAYVENRDKDIDFILAVGGGSAIDAAKAIAILFRNGISAKEILSLRNLTGIPLVAVPTTAGTGSETTPYAILTLHEEKTKRNIGQSIFPDVAFLDARYTLNMPFSITASTAVDAFTHLAEGYLNTRANLLSDTLAEKGLKLFGECVPALKSRECDIDIREKLLLTSSIAGMVIAQTGTSLPHGMGYALTYEKGVPHGTANGILYPGYLRIFKKTEKLTRLLSLIRMDSIDALSAFFKDILDFEVQLSDEEIRRYVEGLLSNEKKLRNHPERVSRDELISIYKNMLKK